jgi:hypothetical protein
MGGDIGANTSIALRFTAFFAPQANFSKLVFDWQVSTSYTWLQQANKQKITAGSINERQPANK